MAHAITPLAACLIIVTICYLGWIVAKPWGRCHWCHPTKRNRRRGRHSCRACNGTGMRPRIAFQIYTHLRRLNRNRASRGRRR